VLAAAAGGLALPEMAAAAGKTAPRGAEALAALIRSSADGNAALMRGDVDGWVRNIPLEDDFLLMSPFGGRPKPVTYTPEHWRRSAVTSGTATSSRR
jgi:hypothetical protein